MYYCILVVRKLVFLLTNLNQVKSLIPEFYLFQKRGLEEANEEVKNPTKVLKGIGEAGKGFVRSIHYLKGPRPTN